MGYNLGMNTDNLYCDLQALINAWNARADEALLRGDRDHERYFYGVMFGLEMARDELASLLAATLFELVKTEPP
jgi:hypothetical protein